MLFAELADDGTDRIACRSDFRFKDLIKAISGARWDGRTALWYIPRTWSSCLALRSQFGTDLEIGPNLNAWALTYLDEVWRPAMALRDAFDFEGDSDLFPHQRADVAWMATVRRGLLANEMGVGKTPSTIRALVELHRRGETVFPALIICPNSMKVTWQRELSRWWPGIKSTVVRGTAVARRKQFQVGTHALIMNYESVAAHSRLAPYGSIELRRCIECGGEDSRVTVTKCQVHDRELNKIKFRTLIADEAHRLKDPTSQQTRAVKAAVPEAQFRFALTGTPIANNIIDLWSILNLIDPHEWPAKTTWIDRMVDVVYNVHGGIVSSMITAGHEKEFQDTIYPRMRRMTKAVVLPFLPPVVTERREVEMTPKQQKAYDTMATQMMAIMEDEALMVAGTPMLQTMRLLQIASSFGEVEIVEVTDPETGAVTQREKLILTAPSSKIDAFMRDLDDLEGRTVIVFAVSRQLIMLLSHALTAKKIDHGLIVGNQPDWQREEARDQFQAGKTRFILATVGAGGTGITLTAADTVVYLQRDWSKINMEQSMARALRIGSERHESILRIDYICPDTMEEVVISTLEGKAALLEDLVKDKELMAKALRGKS